MGRQKGKSQPRHRGYIDHSSIEWRTESLKLKQQLRRLGLQIREATGDGNCLFRAVSDQVEGNENAHGQLRADAVRFMRDNREDFEPFIEDDEPFDGYLRRMATSGTWGGNMELQALSQCLGVNISLHMAGMDSVWEMNNFRENERRIHLSYHLGEHYNSVRLADDNGHEPARPIPSLFRPQIPKEELEAEERKETVEYVLSLIPGAEEYKMQLVLSHLFGQEMPPIEVINEKCGQIANLYFARTDEELIPKSSPIAEEQKTRPQNSKPKAKSVETRPEKLPRNNEKCWCGSNKKYKVCCKAKDAFREVEKTDEEVKNAISSLRI